MDTYFAPAERADEKELTNKVEIINSSPVMSALLQSVSGLLVILDEHRQIVAINDTFLKMLSIDNPAEALGLRPGEALNCIHADKEPAGCGTSKFCSSCGAAIAIVSCLDHEQPAERICALTARVGEQTIDMALLVRLHPIRIEEKLFLLLFLQDITKQQQRAALERTFFHDINNMLSGLIGASELLSYNSAREEAIEIVQNLSLRMKDEVEIQRCLLESSNPTYQPSWHTVNTNQIFTELRTLFSSHPAASGKHLHFQTPLPDVSFRTDISLLLRILCNMVTNGLEATELNGTVKISLRQNDTAISFLVWNNSLIAANIVRRVFQRNFSTKEGTGRGIGTFSMKLFGEKVLGGQVGFTTTEDKGTTFSISLPL